MQFIATEHQKEEIPCRFVQLTIDGATIDSLCRYGTPEELEQTIRCWLYQRIHELQCAASLNAELMKTHAKSSQ
jgi:hypothetical protein